jgi:hypothetical protein
MSNIDSQEGNILESDPNETHLTWQDVGVFGYWVAIGTSLISIISLILAMTAIPNSGANCPSDCVEYPYTTIKDFYPEDYWWMYTAIIMLIAYYILMLSLHHFNKGETRLFSSIAVNFALMSTIVLLMNYYLQLRIIQPSINNGEYDGISIFTQYNPNGVFIALEELGYLLMSLGFLFLAFVFQEKTRISQALKWLFITNFAVTMLALIAYSLIYGFDVEDRFEVIIISVNWLTLIVSGFLLAKIFKS